MSGLQNELTQAISDEVERPIPTELKEKAKGDGIYNVIVYNLLDKSDINKSISEYRTEKQEHKFEQRQLQINGRIIADNIDSAEKDIIFIKIDIVFKKASAILLKLLATRNN